MTNIPINRTFGPYFDGFLNSQRTIFLGGVNPDPQFINSYFPWSPFGAGWSADVANRQALANNALNAYLFLSGVPGLTPGHRYIWQFDLLTRTAGSVQAYIGPSTTTGTAQTVPGTYSGTFIYPSSDGGGEFGLFSPDGFSGTVSNYYLFDQGPA